MKYVLKKAYGLHKDGGKYHLFFLIKREDNTGMSVMVNNYGRYHPGADIIPKSYGTTQIKTFTSAKDGDRGFTSRMALKKGRDYGPFDTQISVMDEKALRIWADAMLSQSDIDAVRRHFPTVAKPKTKPRPGLAKDKDTTEFFDDIAEIQAVKEAKAKTLKAKQAEMYIKSKVDTYGEVWGSF